jgi:hypothetical protein
MNPNPTTDEIHQLINQSNVNVVFHRIPETSPIYNLNLRNNEVLAQMRNIPGLEDNHIRSIGNFTTNSLRKLIYTNLQQ